MDGTTNPPPRAREKATSIRQVLPVRPPRGRGPAPEPGMSVGWILLLTLSYLMGAAALAGGIYVYLR
jgi:hypothetical protein